MSAFKIFSATLLLTLACASGKAQSMYWARQYYNQGKYFEAAKQLQPLADGGNAEAQAMAAGMFFEGKGVPKSDAQALKYAKLAADQGNEDGMALVCGIYYKTQRYTEAFTALQQYIAKHPYLKKGKMGADLGMLYIDGRGTQKDEERGWRLMEESDRFESTMRDQEIATRYYDYQMRKAGKENLEDYADYLYGQRQTQKFNTVCAYIERHHPDMTSWYSQRANEGNAFALAMMADNYYNRDLFTQARIYLHKALSAGSAYARSLEKKVNFDPATYDNVSCSWTGANSNNKLYITRIEHRWNKTIFHFKFNAKHGGSWIRFDEGFYAQTGGRRYMMTSPATRISNPRSNVRDGHDNYFTLEFEAIPTDWSDMSLGCNGVTYITNVRKIGTNALGR